MLNPKTAFKTFEFYKRFLDDEVKKKKVQPEQAYKLLRSARKNYRELNGLKELNKCAK